MLVNVWCEQIPKNLDTKNLTGPQNERFGRWAPTNDEGGLAGLRRGAWQGTRNQVPLGRLTVLTGNPSKYIVKGSMCSMYLCQIVSAKKGEGNEPSVPFTR